MSNIKILLLSMLLLTVGFIWIISNSNEQYKKIQPVTDAANSIVGNTELNPEYLKNSADITEDTVDYDKKLKSIEKKLVELKSSMNDLLNKSPLAENEQTNNPALEQQLSAMNEQQEKLTEEYIDNIFESEGVDARWNANVNTKIIEGISNIESIESSDVQCATTMCRITASMSQHNNDAMSMMHLLDENLDWRGQMRITINHKSGEMTAYLAREGNALPEVSN